MRGRAGRIVSVGGGKGGVGKSLVAANLGVALAREGARVVIVDADLGAPNQHTLFGISRPGATLQALLDRRIGTLEEARIETGVDGLTLVPGASAVVGSANIGAARKGKLLRHVRELDAEVVVVDVGAGVGFSALDLFDVADLRLAVTSPQLTSVQNCYAFLKGAVFRELRRVAAGSEEASAIDEGPEAAEPTRTVASLVERVRGRDPALAASLDGCLASFGARLVGNQVFEPQERNVLYATSRIVRDFLGVDAPVLGVLRASRRIHDSVGAGRPFVLEDPAAEASTTLREVARAVLGEDVRRLRAGREQVGLPGPPSHPSATSYGPDAREEAPPLPASLERRQRAHDRLPVNCPATLVAAGASFPAVIRNVSVGGALLELEHPPPVGTRGELVLTHLDGRPALPCVVRHASEGRAGVEFTAGRDLATGVARSIARRFPP